MAIVIVTIMYVVIGSEDLKFLPEILAGIFSNNQLFAEKDKTEIPQIDNQTQS